MTATPHMADDTRPQFADILPRLSAGLIDLFVLYMQFRVARFLFWLVGDLLELLGTWLGLGEPMVEVAAIVRFAGAVWGGLVALAYFPYWWQRDGWTFGLRVMHLRLVDATDSARRIGALRAVKRGLAALVSLGLLGLGFLWVLVDERRQGWHDKLAGTLVVRTEGDTR